MSVKIYRILPWLKDVSEVGSMHLFLITKNPAILLAVFANPIWMQTWIIYSE